MLALLLLTLLRLTFHAAIFAISTLLTIIIMAITMFTVAKILLLLKATLCFAAVLFSQMFIEHERRQNHGQTTADTLWTMQLW